MALDLSDANRIHPGLSAWIVNDFAQEILGVDPSAFLNKMVNDYEKRGAGKPIVRDVVQWIEGQTRLCTIAAGSCYETRYGFNEATR